MTGLRLTEQLSLAFTSVDDEPSPPTTGEGAEPVVTTEAPRTPGGQPLVDGGDL